MFIFLELTMHSNLQCFFLEKFLIIFVNGDRQLYCLNSLTKITTLYTCVINLILFSWWSADAPNDQSQFCRKPRDPDKENSQLVNGGSRQATWHLFLQPGPRGQPHQAGYQPRQRDPVHQPTQLKQAWHETLQPPRQTNPLLTFWIFVVRFLSDFVFFIQCQEQLHFVFLSFTMGTNMAVNLTTAMFNNSNSLTT